ncbi:16S rRNA (guanine(527)-N(7))-methyltransferase RsmG [Pseudaestuariivita rosea]|uniref:16S rRNA (guanine(527)-N(7))-methyltransferase RsmG n=1 Tax=Pseudaestuariivita rosea TaxID=2763263 RepID=UPI001F0295C2|nr:16S rRNA (guanine(527)-N(7))-methyltransferase RsmG [Pseudaestuariivita rosea]
MHKLQDGINVSRETFEKLKDFEALILKWNKKINLISRSSQSDLWIRHIVDSAQLFDAFPKLVTKYADLGSGGGFPGIILSILLSEKMPNADTILVESDKRKAEFLRSASRTLGLKATVMTDRIEMIAPLAVDLITARALASLDDLLGYAEMHLTTGGIAVFPKGEKAGQEIAVARQNWDFELQEKISKTDPNAVILKVGAIQRV